MDPLQKIQHKIEKLEAKVKELRAANKKLHNKNQNQQLKIERLESEKVNTSELEHLRIENGKLLVEINKLERNKRAIDKLAKIEKIIKG